MRIVKAVWLVVVLAACGGKDPAPGPATAISNQAATAEPSELVAFRTEMCGCRRLACHEQINDRYVAWSKQHGAVEDPAYRECRIKLLGDFGLKVDLPDECRKYGVAMERLFTCDQLAPQTLDALKSSFTQTVAAWADTPAKDREKLAAACRSAADAVNQSAEACK